MTAWPMVPLSEIATPTQRTIQVETGKSYRTIGVKWWGEGAYERQTIDGSETAARTLSLVREGDLIINKIWVRHGSTAVASKDVDGCAASNEFPTFTLNQHQAHSRWIHWLTKTKWFWTQCDALSMGTSGKNRIKPEKFLTIAIPLPPIDDQRRLVTRIDMLATKIDEAKRLRVESDKERHQLTRQAAATILQDNSWPHKALSELLIEDSRNGIGTRPNDEPPGVPILRISAGTSRPDAVVEESDHKYLIVTKKQLEQYLLKKDDLLACRFNGNLRFVGRFSIYRHESGIDQVYPDKLIRFRVDQSRVLPEFVKLAMNSPTGRERIESFCATTAGNIGISATQLKTVSLPVPPLTVQQAVIDHLHGIQRSVTAADADADQVKRELDAILPAILDRAFRGEL